jgi:hypothetical protein
VLPLLNNVQKIIFGDAKRGSLVGSLERFELPNGIFFCGLGTLAQS